MRIALAVLLLTSMAQGQSVVPPMPRLSANEVIGELYAQVATFQRYVDQLQQRIVELDAENRTLKMKCGDRCEEKK